MRGFVADEGEEVLLDAGPHWWPLAGRLVPSALALAAAGAAFWWWRSAPAWFGLVLAAVVVAALGAGAGRWWWWRAMRFVVTSERVVLRRGVLRRSGREIPAARVQDVTFEQGLFERVLGIGSVTVHSAGAEAGEAMPALRRPAQVQRCVNRAVEGARRPSGHGGLVAELERLDELRRRGVLTEAEFRTLKAELLARR